MNYKPNPDNYGSLEIENKSGGLADSARKKFIYKVYIILTMQLLLTAGMCFISYFV